MNKLQLAIIFILSLALTVGITWQYTNKAYQESYRKLLENNLVQVGRELQSQVIIEQTLMDATACKEIPVSDASSTVYLINKDCK